MFIHNTSMFRYAHRQMQTHSNKALTALQRLSSGYRINSAADDPAGLAVSERMRLQITMSRQAVSNAKMNMDMYKTSDGALGEAHTMLNRLVDLANQAASSTLSETQRGSLQQEADQIIEELERLGKSTTFNNRPILEVKGAFSDASTVERDTGPDAMTSARLTAGMPDMSKVLDMLGDFSLDTVASAGKALEAATAAIDTVSSMRGAVGAKITGLEHNVKSMEANTQDLEEAESRIRDADMAKEMMNYTKEQALAQAASMVMAHLMDEPRRVLELVKSM